MGMFHLSWQMRNIFQVKEEILTKGNSQYHGARAVLLELKIFRNLGYQGGWNSPREQVSAEMGISEVEENPSLETLKTQLGEVLGNLGRLDKCGDPLQPQVLCHCHTVITWTAWRTQRGRQEPHHKVVML